MFTITPIPAFSDNYIWVIVDDASKQAVVVDPGDATPVLHYLASHALTLCSILITHHHADHTGGIHTLIATTPVPVFGPANEHIPQCDHPVKEGDKVTIDSMTLTFDVLDIPGHTRGHIAYLGHGWLFCGDTLFSGGCGRLFEGTAIQMYTSLEKLAAVPKETQVFCAHEYTAANLRFAQTIEPGNTALQQRIDEVKQLRDEGAPSLPSSIAIERDTNPFLRCNQKEVIINTEKQTSGKLSPGATTFAALRALKDQF